MILQFRVFPMNSSSPLVFKSLLEASEVCSHSVSKQIIPLDFVMILRINWRVSYETLLIKYPDPGSNRDGLPQRCLRPSRLPIPPSGQAMWSERGGRGPVSDHKGSVFYQFRQTFGVFISIRSPRDGCTSANTSGSCGLSWC